MENGEKNLGIPSSETKPTSELKAAPAEDYRVRDGRIWAEQGMATSDYDTCQRCGRRYGTFQPDCPNIHEHYPRHRPTVVALSNLLRLVGGAYPDDPGTSDLDDEQPTSVSLTLKEIRLAWRLLDDRNGQVASEQKG